MEVLQMARHVFHVVRNLYEKQKLTVDQYRSRVEHQVQLHGKYDRNLRERLDFLERAYKPTIKSERVITTEEYFGGLESLALMYL